MKVEQIDDLGVLSSVITDLQIGKLLDTHFKVHGNWRGISLGSLSTVFLLYVLSEGDHRLSHIEDWSASRELVLGYLLGADAFSQKDCTDDRLGALLDYLSDDTAYRAFEDALNQQIVTVYSLQPASEEPALTQVHLDATIAQSFSEGSDLLALGYAKHRRPDLVQTKIMLSTLAPFGLPLCVDVVNGACADDGLYVPMVERVRTTLSSERDLLFVGDCKMGSVATRSHIVNTQNYYLTPLSRVQCPLTELHALLTPENRTQTIILNEDEIPAFEVLREMRHTDTVWQERRIVAFSRTFAQSQTTAFNAKLNTAENAINDILTIKQGKTPIKTQVEIEDKIAKILKKHALTEFFKVEIQAHTTQTQHRKYGNRPAQTVTQTTFSLTTTRNTAAIDTHVAALGWRIYATNAPTDRLATADALQAYKEEYQVEHRFNDLHNKIAPLMPIFLHKDTRIIALIRLLFIAIKIHTIIEFNVRKALAIDNETINHIFPGNPTRKTNKPTTQMLLRAFRAITLVIIYQNNQIIHIEVSELSPLQKRICTLIGIQTLIYANFTQFLKSKAQMGET